MLRAAPTKFRRIRLDRLRNVELARHRAALSHKQILPTSGFHASSVYRLPGTPSLRPRALSQDSEQRHAVQAVQCERDLSDVRVASALSHAINGALNPRCAASHRCHRAGRCHSKIVVSVPMQRNVCGRPSLALCRIKNSTASGPHAPIVSTTTISLAPAFSAVA